MPLLFVYGTLMRGEAGHHHLGDARFVGAWTTPPHFRMVVVDWYPAIGPGERSVDGEVFDVAPSRLSAIDAYEGDGYLREILPTPWGAALVYVWPALPPGLEDVPNGRWRSVGRRGG